jgi:hypothetical protein
MSSPLARWNHALCMESLKSGLLARACIVPGFITLVANLMTSSCGIAFNPETSDVRLRGTWGALCVLKPPSCFV